MEKLSLQDVQTIEMDILDAIDQVCESLGIQYFLAYGSLLGAIRHKGFIPWDDDMDIFMLRQDYEKLVANFNDMEGIGSYRLAIYRDGASNLPYAKVVDPDTKVDMRLLKDEYSTGIWVDIFPLDFIETEKPPLMLREKALFCTRVIASSVPAPGRPAWQNALIRMSPVVSRFVNPIDLAGKLDEAAKRRCPAGTPFLCDIVGEPEHPRCYKREWFEPIRVPFGDRSYYAPAGYEEILATSYGDWKTLPPEDKRVPHGLEAYRIARA